MKKLSFMIVIAFVLSLTVYSCAKKNDDSASSASTTATFTIKGGMQVQNDFAKLKIKELNFCKAISKLNNIAHSSKGRQA